MQCIDAPLSLNHREGWLDLPTKPRGLIPEDRNTEATFAVDEADDPLRETWPFLLIVRTGRIFTSHVPPNQAGVTWMSTVGFSEFPAFGRLHMQDHSSMGQSPGTFPGGLP
jgi:hypothetical protein